MGAWRAWIRPVVADLDDIGVTMATNNRGAHGRMMARPP